MAQIASHTAGLLGYSGVGIGERAPARSKLGEPWGGSGRRAAASSLPMCTRVSCATPVLAFHACHAGIGTKLRCHRRGAAALPAGSLSGIFPDVLVLAPRSLAGCPPPAATSGRAPTEKPTGLQRQGCAGSSQSCPLSPCPPRCTSPLLPSSSTQRSNPALLSGSAVETSRTKLASCKPLAVVSAQHQRWL